MDDNEKPAVWKEHYFRRKRLEQKNALSTRDDWKREQVSFSKMYCIGWANTSVDVSRQ